MRRVRPILRSNLNGKNKIMAVNNRAVSTMHGRLHPKSDVDRVYRNRKMGGRGLISCDRCIRMEENNLGWNVRNSVEPLIEGAKVAETIEYNNTVNKRELKKSWLREKRKLWRKKKNVWD